MDKKTRKIAAICALIAMFMFSFSFALSPLYQTFCQVTGLSTNINIAQQPDALNDGQVTVQFVTTNNRNIPWEFYPETNSINTVREKNTAVMFYAKNTTSHRMTVQAIPSYMPVIAVKYFHKIECFCFQQQTLAAGESKKMPVIFRLDKKLPRDVGTITLAYTLFDVTERTSS